MIIAKRMLFAVADVQIPLPKVYDRSGRPNNPMQAHTGGDQAWRGVKIDEIWFDRFE